MQDEMEEACCPTGWGILCGTRIYDGDMDRREAYRHLNEIDVKEV